MNEQAADLYLFRLYLHALHFLHALHSLRCCLVIEPAGNLVA